ncbi:MAG: hypothetical protein P8N27_05540 [Polaribacter sp.]|nr:hypothetical protein [Polaribacter sp.]
MKLLKNIYWIIFPLIPFILDVVLNIENFFMRTFTTSAIAFFLSPKKKKIKIQTGEKTQITWFFLKEPIFLN